MLYRDAVGKPTDRVGREMKLRSKGIPGQWAGIILWAKASVNADRNAFGLRPEGAT